MITKLNSLNKNIILFDLLVLLGIQFILFYPVTNEFVIHLLIINLLIFAGLYSFRAFDFQVIRFLQNAFINTLAGTFLGVLLAIAPIFYFQIKIPKVSLIIISITYLLILPLLNNFIGTNYIKSLTAKKYLVIGKEESFGELLKEIKKASLDKVNPVLYINPEPAIFDEVIFNAKKADSVLVADINMKKGIEDSLKKVRQRGMEILYLPELVETSLSRIPLEVIENFKDYYEVIFEKGIHSPSKRLYDIAASLILLMLLSPFLILFSLALFIESGSPIIFKQERVGQNNKLFTIYKLRTLRGEADENNPNAGIEDRVTIVGKVLRKLRLDEFPQLINVLKGEMSLIGPRPEMIHFHQMCMEEVPYYFYRNLAKPGITGWAQDNYKHTTTLEDYKRKTEYDLYYVKNKRLLLDLQITLRTMVTMVGMRGAR